jgi:hypothetical protein
MLTRLALGISPAPWFYPVPWHWCVVRLSTVYWAQAKGLRNRIREAQALHKAFSLATAKNPHAGMRTGCTVAHRG